MIIETTEPTFHLLKECLSELALDIKVELISRDPVLKALGFVAEVPCVIKVEATPEQRNEIIDLTIDLEIAAYNTPSGYPDEKSEEYRNYKRYGWLYDFFYDFPG